MRLILCALLLMPGWALAQDRSEIALVKAVFAKVQPLSIRKNREYCGYIGYDAEGRLVASRARQGRTDSCEPRAPKTIETIIASYHTHGAFSRGFYSEVPSGSDMEADEAEGIDGWVATPGGRLWYIDTEDMVTSQICGIGCLPRDARFERGDMGRIRRSYSYDELVEKLAEE